MSLIFACLAVIVVDGDTFRCLEVETARPSLRADLAAVKGKVRLARIDTPERGAPGYTAATRALRVMIDGRSVSCTLVDADPGRKGFQRKDRFGRPVARCRVGSVDVGAAMLAQGHAVRWPRR
jgi:endonuclease YncB( thermonuclease family)